MLKLLLLLALVSVTWCQNHSSPITFTNPILKTQGADPWVIRHDGWYYMTLSTGTAITLLRSTLLTYVSPPNPWSCLRWDSPTCSFNVRGKVADSVQGRLLGEKALLTPCSDWNSAESKVVFAPAPGLNYSTDIWAPELHKLNGAWYIIFTADPRNDAPPPEVDM